MVGGWVLYLLFPLFCLVPGILLLFLLESWPKPLSLGEFLFRAVLAGFLFHSAVALVLVEIGLLQIVPFLALEGFLGLLLLLMVGVRRPARPRLRLSWEDLIPLALLLVAALLPGKPHTAMLGGSDPGTYIGIAAAIAHSGSLRLTDTIWAAMDAEWARQEFLFRNMPGLSMPYHRLPGYYAVDAASGTILPQFYPLYPLWLALGFKAVGFPSGLYVTPVLAAWAIVAVYYAGRAVVGSWPALAGTLLLALNPLFVWLGQHSISEVPAQFLLFGSVYALVTFLRGDERDRAAGVLAGAALGGFLHTRPDAVLALGLLGLWLAFRLLAPGRRWSTLRPLLFALGVALLHWGLYLGFFAWGYTSDALGGALRFLLGPIAWPVLLLGIAGFGLAVFLARRGRWPTLFAGLRVAVAVGVLLLAGFAWFIWPRLSPPQSVGFYAWDSWQFYPATQGQNFLHLTWYLLPLGVALGLAGFCLAVLQEQAQRIAFIGGLALLYGLLYTYHTADYPAQPLVMRRQFVVVVPTLLLMAGYALWRLARAPRWAARVAAAALVLFLGWAYWDAAGLARQVDDFAGLERQVASLAESTTPRDIFLFTDVSAGTLLAFPLQYIYGRPCFVLQRPQPDDLALREQVRDWRAEGREVYILVAQGASRISPAVFSLQWLRSVVLRWEQLEMPLDRPPRQAVEERLLYNLYRLGEAGEYRGAHVVDVGGADYPYLAGGFWAPEQMLDGTTFRWTDGDATIELPGEWFASAGPLTLTVDLQLGWEPREGDNTLEVWLDGVLLGRLSPDLQLRRYALPLPADLCARPAGQGSALLRLRGSAWRPADSGLADTRRLGVVVDRIAVR